MIKRMVVEGKLMKWGNSYGIRIGKSEVSKHGLQVNEELKITVEKKANPFKELFCSDSKNKINPAVIGDIRRENDSKW